VETPPNEDDFRWEDPRPPSRTLISYGAALQTVHKRPGAWARIRVFTVAGSAYSAARGLRVAATDKHWEFRSARLLNPPKRYGLYARFRTDAQMKE